MLSSEKAHHTGRFSTMSLLLLLLLLLFLPFLQKSLSLLFVQCCRTLQLDDNLIRSINALQVCKLLHYTWRGHRRLHALLGCSTVYCSHSSLQTLCVLLRATFEKKLTDMSFDVIDVVVGFDSAECQMRVSGGDEVSLSLHSVVCGVITRSPANSYQLKFLPPESCGSTEQVFDTGLSWLALSPSLMPSSSLPSHLPCMSLLLPLLCSQPQEPVPASAAHHSHSHRQHQSERHAGVHHDEQRV